MIAFALRSADKLDPTVNILVQPAVAFEEACARAVAMDMGGVPLSVAAIDDLIRLKTGTGRQRDQGDIDALRRVLDLNLAKRARDGEG